MKRRDIEQRARMVMSSVLGVPASRLRDNAGFHADLGATAAHMNEIFARLRAAFLVSISSEEAAFCQSVGTAFDLIENKLELRVLCSGQGEGHRAMTIHVTENAIDRYITVIDPVSREDARARIASAERGVDAAARFGAHIVKTATAKLVLQGDRVVNVLPRNWIDHAGMTNAERAAVYAENAAAWA